MSESEKFPQGEEVEAHGPIDEERPALRAEDEEPDVEAHGPVAPAPAMRPAERIADRPADV